MNKAEFIDTVMNLSGISNEKDAERISVAILQVLRSQLSSNEHRDIYHILPKDIEELWEGGWLQRLASRLQHVRIMDKNDFIEQAREAADLHTESETENLVRAVFAALKAAISQKEINHVDQNLPDELREMWNTA